MGMRKKIALLVGQPEEKRLNPFIRGFIKRAFSDDCDVCVFSMYQRNQTTKSREQGEAHIFSLVEFDMFEKTVVLTDTIQTKGITDQIMSGLYGCDAESVIFADENSPYVQKILQEEEPLAEAAGGEAGINDAEADGSGTEVYDIGETSDFNVGTMEDDMLAQTELSYVVSVIYSYVDQIRPFESFHLCLNKEMEVSDEDGTCAFYSERMLDALSCRAPDGGGERVDVTAEFDRRQMLPELSEDRDGPRAYFFTPLYFEEHCFGYAVINYGETIRCYDAAYKIWLRSVMRGLECFWRIRVLEAKNAVLETSQIRDSLTGFYNYRGFLKTAVGMMKEISDENGFIHITVIELCGLNEIYLNFGSREGDNVIVDFSQLLFGIAGKELLCYLGNAEFLIARVSLDEREEAPEAVVEELRGKLEDYSHSSGMDGKLSITFGDMQGTACDEEALGNLVGEAVSRKNANKIKEQRQIQKSLTEAERKNVELVTDILDHNRLIYFFQPIVDANTGDIFAYEALMRADTEEPVSPLEILKWAEYLGRLSDVEKATFLNVLSYAEAHKEQFEGRKVFINSIPGIQIPDEDARAIQEKLVKTSVQVVVELTEQAELMDSELDTLKSRLEKLGVGTAVDDYGTGYSNVYNLLRYMPDVVKIDRMLLANIQLSAQKQHFVKEIIEFSHDNQITVLAEGIETSEELGMVIALGVDLIQGYYTAKPGAEVVTQIDPKIQNEIVQYGQFALQKSKRSVYTVRESGSISLVKLVAGHYSKISFAGDGETGDDVIVIGRQGFSATMEIEVEDFYSGKIELRDVDLAIHNEKPAIKLGNNCDVTLVLSGENVLEQGGILVPESSKLTVQGTGELAIRQIAINGYGIGNDKDSRHGDLHFEQDGLIKIRGNTMHGVGIGSGYGGNIHIGRGMYSIRLAGEKAVGIGALYADVDLAIRYCAIDIDMKNAVSVGIGSVTGKASVDICAASVNGLFSANRCVGIGTADGEYAKFELREGTVELNARSEYLCGIGSILGDADISFVKFSVNAAVDGREAISVGNASRTAVIHTKNGDFVSHVKNMLGYDIGADTLEIINGYSEFTLNGEEIKRETVTGDM